MTDWDKLAVRGLLLAGLVGAGWYYLYGPHSKDTAAVDAQTSANLAEEAQLFRDHTRLVHEGDTANDLAAKMRRPADKVRRSPRSDEHLWYGPDGSTFSAQVEIASGRATSILFKEPDK